MKQEPISCRADNALAAHCQSFAARWVCVYKRSIFYLAAYIDNNHCCCTVLANLLIKLICKEIKPTTVTQKTYFQVHNYGVEKALFGGLD